MSSGKGSARKRKRWAFIALIAVSSVVATVLLGNLRFFQLVHLKASDFHFLVRGKRPTSNIVVIAIDQKSLNSFHELLMFWHPYYAEAIKAAAEGGAKVLGFDWVFAVDVKTWEPDHDRLLSEAVISTMATMPVVCAYVSAMNSKQVEWPVQINMLAAAYNNNAFANLTTDSDDFVRNQVLIEEPDANGEFSRNLAFRVAEKFRGMDSKVENGRLVWNGRAIPTTPSRTITINYAGPTETFPFVSLVDFIRAARAGNKEQIRQWVGGKVVLLGPDSETEDRHPTPFYTAFSGLKYLSAGVEIHANTLRTLLDDDYIVPVSNTVRLASLALVTLLTAIAMASLAARQTAFWIALGVGATAVVTHLLFRYGVMISTSELLLGCLISLLSSMAYRVLTAEKVGVFFQNAISVFVGKQFAATISEEQRISLSGKRMPVTILFSDIRGFTAFCEEKDPAVVVDLLNEYMAGMVKIIVRYHGNVNKFIGDGILAIFSDEDEEAVPGDHALRAVRCGTEMALLPGKFKTGVGIHSGPAVVGNIGSEDKMEYTVLGDTVNLASRLESLNKEMKTRLIMSEATRELLNGQFETAYLAEVPVRGKTLPLVIHTSAVLAAPKPESETLAEKT
jgi:adenylate cyclase